MNSYNYSYNVLINRLEAFAAGHFLIKRFTHGQIDMSDQLQDDQYPFMHVTPDTIEPVPGAMNFGFHIMFADIPRDKEYKSEYQREVISDCIRLGQDLIAEVKNGLELFGFDVQLLETPTFEPFMEEQKNTVTGVAFTIKLSVPWDWSACDIPAIWSVGGASGSGGSGTGYGIELQTNSVDNIVQTKLNLVDGTNITITDLGNGSVSIDAGGSTADYVSTAFNVNHTTATGNPYVVGDRVWYSGNVYQCIANNDAILPTNNLYWVLVAIGNRLRQTPVDWNATTGDFQVLNKPTIPAAQVNSDWNASSGVAQILNKPTIPAGQVNSDWNSVSGVSQILNKPTLATVATTGSYTDLINQPTIPAAQVNSDWNSVSGVSQILNKPTIPAAQVNSDWNAVSGLAEILNKPTIPTTLDSLTNVNVPAPSNAQVLTYDTATSQWIASTPTSGSGTVTSVGLTMPAAFSVSGSPVTTSGTLAVTATGTSAQYVRGDGALATTPTALPPNGAASGDLQGSYPSPTVHRIHNYDMQSGLPADGDTWVVVPTPFGTQPVEWRHQKLNVTQLGDTTTVGQNIATLPNPNAIRYLRINADNSVSAISLATLKSEIGAAPNFTFKTTNDATTATAYADVPEMNFAVTAGVSYNFKFICIFSAAAATTGSKWSVNGPASPTRLIYRVMFPASTAGAISTAAFTTYDAGVATLNSGSASNNCAIVEGVIAPSANGTVSLRFATETAGSAITAQINTYLELIQI